MTKFCYSSVIFFLLVFVAQAQNSDKLKFTPEGDFKIVQFTDTHIDLIDKDNLNVYETIPEVLAIEKPNLVILTGDIVTQDNPQEAFRQLADIFSKASIPWAVVFGNHESEHNFSREKLAAFLKTLPFCLNDDKGTITGNSNFILPVFGSGEKPEALLYCMDSNDYSTLQPTVDGYGWFGFSQIEWYRKNSSKYTAANNGKPLPALAFFHIPFPEYTDAWNNKAAGVFGVKNEDECSPQINTGMFAAMLENGDVMGTFCGHDHINDYIGTWFGVALAYGRVSKIMRSAEDPMAGGRVIVLKEGQRKFETWIRERGGKKVLDCTYPDSFVLKK